MTTIIDTHVHVYRSKSEGLRAKSLYDISEYGNGGQPQFAHWAGDAADAAQCMAAAGVDVGIVTNLMDPPLSLDGGKELIAFNEWLLGLAEERPQFLPCLAVDPRYLSIDDTAFHLRQMASRGHPIAIKIHPPMQELDVSDEAVWPIFEVCQELGLRVVAHSGPSQSGIQRGEPNAFRPVLDAFPRLGIALAHLGGASWQQSPRLAADYPNVYFDLCEIIEWCGADRAPTREGLVKVIREIGVHRVMMGSDFPWYDMKHTVELVKSLPSLTGAEASRVLGLNAQDFFGLATPRV